MLLDLRLPQLPHCLSRDALQLFLINYSTTTFGSHVTLFKPELEHSAFEMHLALEIGISARLRHLLQKLNEATWKTPLPFGT